MNPKENSNSRKYLGGGESHIQDIKPADNIGGVTAQGVIHIVDDEKDIVTVAASFLERNGYAIHSFTSASEALKDIELKCRKNVRMLITDIRMPEHNGFEVAKRTRAIVPDVPIVFITAFEVHLSEFEKIFPSFGGQIDFLQKPFHVGKLLQVVKKYDNVRSK